MFEYLAAVRTGTSETFQLEGKLVVQITFFVFGQYRASRFSSRTSPVIISRVVSTSHESLFAKHQTLV